jgi:hypothetical protein
VAQAMLGCAARLRIAPILSNAQYSNELRLLGTRHHNLALC